jgi:hypothetical protein
MAKSENVFGKSMKTPKGILFFADVDTPNTKEKHPNNKYPSDKYDVTIGIPKDVDLKDLKAECDRVAKQAFDGVDGVDMPFSNGDEKSMTSMKGFIVIRAKCSKRPGCVNGALERILESEIQPGMWGRVQVTPMSYLSGRNKGVSLIFKNLQVLTDEEFTSLGGGEESAESVFAD